MKSLALIAVSALALVSFHRPGPEPAPAVPGGGEYVADPAHSSVVFATDHLGVSRFYGRFNAVSATLQFNDEDLSQSRVSIEIPVESVDTNSDQRDGHLKSPDFFSAKEFPLITFESSAVRGTKEAFTIEGELTMRGTTRKVSAQGRMVGTGPTMFGDERAGFEARLTLEPVDFGFTFMEKNPKALGPTVEVIVSLECIAQ